MKPKLIVILGPTATGKSDVAVRLAQKYGGEVVSADSRQVYKGLNLGTGKVTEKEMRGIPHHLLDVVSPQQQYTVTDFVRDTKNVFVPIYRYKHIPILVGGTGQYIDTLVFGLQIPNVPPNKKLRMQLEKLSAEKLFSLLHKKDLARAKTIDRHNKRRLIRALEIVDTLGKVPKTKKKSLYSPLYIGLTLPKEKLHENIHKRLIKRLKLGLVAEVQDLHKHGLSWKRMEELGLEYRYISRFLQKKITKKEMLTQLELEIQHYAKRQITWFKRNKNILWFDPKKDVQNIEDTVKRFLTT
ncbi:MAG: tRNA (adenosine(37)-N6)-dimethylallyltransferase MiaA [Candidatus Campbellbacteria bacterium]|nr:tRNA (adenosine(37)-N6)-dimethylallyltransferase MiaA [Candidatus Campbellbacteria bacterium]